MKEVKRIFFPLRKVKIKGRYKKYTELIMVFIRKEREKKLISRRGGKIRMKKSVRKYEG